MIMEVAKRFTPPGGTTFRTGVALPLAKLSECLCRIVSFLQVVAMENRLARYDDWLEHDGFHFFRGQINIHDLFDIVGTGRSIIETTPGDDNVFVGIGPPTGQWYLRFRAEWDDDGNSIIGWFDFTLPDALANSFREDVVPQLSCAMIEESADEYFRRITD